ncbi:transglycosylase SLT domain-containing protein [Sphingomonas arantia]|uniref:Transglycosylase SLT domain-containing protein n=1 Tax=Sphingomonas arantia TaxID=1460676 RepID=A0ABW4U0U8_9SPHN
MSIRTIAVAILATATLPAGAVRAQDMVYGFGLQPRVVAPTAPELGTADVAAPAPAPTPATQPWIAPSATAATTITPRTATPATSVSTAAAATPTPKPVAPAPTATAAAVPPAAMPLPATIVIPATSRNLTSRAVATARFAPSSPFTTRTAATPAAALPAQLDASQREGYRAVFAAIRAHDWSSAAARLDAMGAGPLHAVARAELYLAKGSPRVETDALVSAIGAAPWLPQSAQMARLAATRGAVSLPVIPYQRDLVHLDGAPKRRAAQTTRSDLAAADLSRRVLPLIKDDRTAEAEALLVAAEPVLSGDALVEWRQRIAWSYYLNGDDANARRLAAASANSTGEWAIQADWVQGLASWRAHDCNAAGQAFSRVASRARDSEMTAAGLFWSARADVACGRPEQVQSRLRTAARMSETFYGLLAAGALGTAIPAPDHHMDFAGNDWSIVASRPNLVAAVALKEIGEDDLADELLRYQARIGSPSDHESLLHLAARLNLPATQIWLAQNGPVGARMSANARYPAPGWTPQRGWRVDKSLILAHALQESQFRVGAVSPAGARGLMQVLPGTADLINKRRGEGAADRSRLNDPSVNFEYGQAYLEQLAQSWMTGGLLPKVIAAYNAGPGSVQKWNERGRNLTDPLLFIESIPFYETRAYVAIVLRNYWMYQRQSGAASASLKAMAQGLWPRFPGMSGATAIRMDGTGATASIARSTSGAN